MLRRFHNMDTEAKATRLHSLIRHSALLWSDLRGKVVAALVS